MAVIGSRSISFLLASYFPVSRTGRSEAGGK